jgi:N6-adenosine-specific RNA methylase IME4
MSTFQNLRPLSYSVILADPPWSFKIYSSKGAKKSPQAQYSCMDLPAIKALPVAKLAAPNAVCIMWATAPMLPQALETMAAWGVTYKTSGAWAKQSSTGEKWAFGTGYLFRSAAEFFLLGTIGSPKSLAKNIRNLIIAPVREHSRKPDEMHERIERQFSGPYVELFARQQRPGWDCWGNQTNHFEAAE